MAVQISKGKGKDTGVQLSPRPFQSPSLQLPPYSTIDFDAAVRILRAFIRDMTGSSGFHKDKLLAKPVDINDVRKAIESLPDLNRLTPEGITVGELLKRVSNFSRIDSVKDAVEERLNAH